MRTSDSRYSAFKKILLSKMIVSEISYHLGFQQDSEFTETLSIQEEACYEESFGSTPLDRLGAGSPFLGP